MESKLIKEVQGITVRMSKAQQIRTLAKVREIAKSTFSDYGDQLILDMEGLAKVEANFSYRLLDEVVNVDTLRPSREQLQSALEASMKAPVGDGVSIQDAIDAFSKNKTRAITQVFRDGFVTGSTTQEMTSIVKNITKLERRQAEALVRTSTNHVAAQARKITEEANADIVDGFEVVATLDSRTTLICGGLDGKRFPHDADRPPYHWSCRTTTIPYIKPEFRIPGFDGDRPAKGAEGVEQVSGDTKYGSWLRRQPAAFQDDILGRTRGALFRRGGVKIDQFTDRNRATYTIDDLKRNNASAFEKANV